MVAGHRIRHYVYAGREMIPRTAGMRGAWGCDAKCSCGWESATGGAVRSYIDKLVAEHKWDVEHGFWPEPVAGEFAPTDGRLCVCGHPASHHGADPGTAHACREKHSNGRTGYDADGKPLWRGWHCPCREFRLAEAA